MVDSFIHALTRVNAPCVCTCVYVCVCRSAAFDDDSSCITGSGRVDFSDGNKVVSSSGGSHSVVLLNRGGFKSGKVPWLTRAVGRRCGRRSLSSPRSCTLSQPLVVPWCACLCVSACRCVCVWCVLGQASWEMKLEEDTNSQCTCFGAAIKPVRDCNYEKSKELIMYRAYNG